MARGFASRGVLAGVVAGLAVVTAACSSGSPAPVAGADVVQPGLTSDLEVLSGLTVTPSQMGAGWTSRSASSSDNGVTGVTALDACSEDVSTSPAPESTAEVMLNGGGSWLANRVLVYKTVAQAESVVTSFANDAGSSTCNPALGQGQASNPEYLTEGVPIPVTWLSGAGCMVENTSTGQMATVILQRRGRFISIVYGPVQTRRGEMFDAAAVTLTGATAATNQLNQLTQTVAGA